MFSEIYLLSKSHVWITLNTEIQKYSNQSQIAIVCTASIKFPAKNQEAPLPCIVFRPESEATQKKQLSHLCIILHRCDTNRTKNIYISPGNIPSRVVYRDCVREHQLYFFNYTSMFGFVTSCSTLLKNIALRIIAQSNPFLRIADMLNNFCSSQKFIFLVQRKPLQ